tara:strand:- start:500 stop:664 length:165 start_codon:yes stop_codon:yes gene_type:complete
MGNYFCGKPDTKNQKDDFQIHPQIINRINKEFDDFLKYKKENNIINKIKVMKQR